MTETAHVPTIDLVEENMEACADQRAALQALIDAEDTDPEHRIAAIQALGELRIRCTATARDLHIQMLNTIHVRPRRRPDQHGGAGA